jgi:hypothetical protein
MKKQRTDQKNNISNNKSRSSVSLLRNSSSLSNLNL